MRALFSALAVGLLVLGSASAFAQSTKAILADHEKLADHENRITDLEGDVQDLDGRVTALEGNGNGNGQGGPFVFVGFSESTVVGRVGVDGLTGQCGVSARVCTTKEFMLSTDIDAPGGDGAWILPEIVAATGTSCVDFSGREDTPCIHFSCSGWGSGGEGMSVNSDGALVFADCDISRFVTCCGPAQ